MNPYKQETPILLVPKDFLNVLPEINSDDFADTIDLAERLRNDFNSLLYNFINDAPVS